MAKTPNIQVEQNPASTESANKPNQPAQKESFPTPDDSVRLNKYDFYNRLFEGHHFEAFSIQIQDDKYNKAYQKLRYVMANFAGLVSRVVADMLFSEPLTINVPDGDQEFVDALWHANKMDIQLYESALTASSLGDAVFKIRGAPRNPEATDKATVIIEEITPYIYFPQLNPFNVKEDPKSVELAWTFKQGDDTYLRKEIHSFKKIENKVFAMKGTQVLNEVDLSVLGIDDIDPVEEVKVDRPLIYHIPNWKTGRRYFGYSDYLDLEPLFYALNNRMTMIDNILDKHSDPILMVPPGVLDEEGKVKKKALGVIEYEEGATGEPKYIVWDASLENAFKEIDKLVEMLYMVSETSPDILGMGQGQAASGRALKLKLLRTIAKTRRKRLYYDNAIKQLIFTAQLVAKEYGFEVDGKKMKKDPVIPELEWQDGLPIDQYEQIEIEEKRVGAGLTTKKASIMRLDNVDDETAQEEVDAIDEETKISMPTMDLGNNPTKKDSSGTPSVPPSSKTDPKIPPAK